MAFSRLFADDEELGKKDDDFRPPNHRHKLSSQITHNTSWLTGPRMRRRRIAILAAAIALVYLFIHNMPGPLGPVADRVDARDPSRTIKGVPLTRSMSNIPDILQDKSTAEKEEAERAGRRLERPSPTQAELRSEDVPPVLRGNKKTAEHYYDGPLKFYKLPQSLNAISHTKGYLEKNRNIVFAAANLQSASRLVPLACEMAKYNRNYVHFAFLGRDGVSLDTLKEVNGASKDCGIYWHDARPDDSEISTEARMEYSVTSALYHINSYMHPQAYITDENYHEDRYFIKSVQQHAARVGKSLIKLPEDAAERMAWITRLDHASLAAWNTIYIDILVHVPPGASGSLIRLLKTIAEADYFGSRTPHLTIELPPVIEPAVQRFLDNFIWPPLPKDGSEHISKVTLRKRVSTAHLTPLEASVRTVESFYSARPRQSHVLLLSTRAELSPLYYHYLFYNVLEYGYGWYSQGTYDQNHLAGIALDLPSVKLDGSHFEPPSPKDAETPSPDLRDETPFLWQVANTNAALYFGSKWHEFHSYLSHRIATPPPEPSQKMVSAAFPAFAEPLLELMRARNYYLHFPHLPSGNAIATIHNELATLPEEFIVQDETPEDEPKSKPPASDILYLEPAEPPQAIASNREGPLLTTSLVALLPGDGDLPELHTLPVLSWDAFVLKRAISADQASKYATNLRRSVGGCSAAYVARVDAGSLTADDLFCRKPDRSQQAVAPPAKVTDAMSSPPKAYEPVRAGIEAALADYSEDEVPNAFRAHPKAKSKDEAAQRDKEGLASSNAEILQESNLIFDASPPPSKPGGDASKPAEAPNQKVPGELKKDASMEEIFEAEKEKARKQMGGGGVAGGEQQQQQQQQQKELPRNFRHGDIPVGGADRKAAQLAMADRLRDKSKMAGSPPGPYDGIYVPKVSDSEKDAMRREAAAHLDRLSRAFSDEAAAPNEKRDSDDGKGTAKNIALEREMAEMASG